MGPPGPRQRHTGAVGEEQKQPSGWRWLEVAGFLIVLAAVGTCFASREAGAGVFLVGVVVHTVGRLRR